MNKIYNFTITFNKMTYMSIEHNGILGNRGFKGLAKGGGGGGGGSYSGIAPTVTKKIFPRRPIPV